MVAVVSYGYDLPYLLDLDFLSLNHLLEKSREVRNNEILENTIAMRNAMNADEKQFNKFSKHYSNEPESQVEEQKIAEGRAALSRLFGGK